MSYKNSNASNHSKFLYKIADLNPLAPKRFAYSLILPARRMNSCLSQNKEPSWFNGGDKPNVYATFGPEFGFRWKPVKQFVARLTIGWNIFAGPFFGIAGDYGL